MTPDEPTQPHNSPVGDVIRLRGAREHNLDDLDLDLSTRGLTVITGLSGSGKSSLAFDTVYSEGRRRYLQALSSRQAGLRRPDMDRLDGLPPTIALRQIDRTPGPLELVGMYTDTWSLLALIFARAGTQHDPESGEAIRPTTHDHVLAELFEDPRGRLMIEAPLLPSEDVSMRDLLDEVALAGFSRVRLRGEVRRLDELVGHRALDPDVRVVVDRIRLGPDRRPRVAEGLRAASAAGRGVIVLVHDGVEKVFVDRPFSLSTRRSFAVLEPARFSIRGPARCPGCKGSGEDEAGEVCPQCGGGRLDPVSSAVRWRGCTLPELADKPVGELVAWLAQQPADEVVSGVVHELAERLAVVERLGLSALRLAQPCVRLSRGEWQRLRLARQVAARLSGVLYVLDEPTAGLDEPSVERVIAELGRLVALGNGLLVVSHQRRLVQRADRVLVLGPGAGALGGRLLYDGPPSGVQRLNGPTGRWMAGTLPAPVVPDARPGGSVRVRGLCARGVSGVNIELPLQALCAVTGPASAGASGVLYGLSRLASASLGADPLGVRAESVEGLNVQRVLVVDEARVGGTSSMPATFVGLWDVLRELLAATTEARVRGLTARHFSLSVKGGRCEACKGAGERRIDLGFLPPAWLRCEVCGGRRFQSDVLDIRWRGRNAEQLLAASARDAHPILAGHPRLERMLRALIEVGLDYVPLGQAAHTLSGGEARRLRLARELGKTVRGVAGTLFVLDEPTAGLHPENARHLIELLGRLVQEGATVWVASHDPALLNACHFVHTVG